MNRITLIQNDQIESELRCEKPLKEILVNGEKILQIHDVCRDVKKIGRATHMCVIITAILLILTTGMVSYLYLWIHKNKSDIQESIDQNIVIGQSQNKMKESKILLDKLGYIWDNQTKQWKENE